MGRKSVPNEVRHQIIGLLKDDSKSNVEIAKIVGISAKCVWTTRKNFNEVHSRSGAVFLIKVQVFASCTPAE